jgi:hypothetical protein
MPRFGETPILLRLSLIFQQNRHNRLLSFITQNWRGKPLVCFEAIVSLIAATTTTNGLAAHSELATNTYPPGLKVSDKDFAQVRLRRDRFRGKWNYEIRPATFNAGSGYFRTGP